MNEGVLLDQIFQRDSDYLKEVCDDILDDIRDDFGNYKDELILTYEGEEYILPQNAFLFALLYLPIRYPLKRSLTLDDLLVVEDPHKLNKELKEYLDLTLKEFLEEDHPDKEMAKELFLDNMSKVLSNVARVAWEINLIKGNSFNIYDMIHLMAYSPKIRKILSYESATDKQYAAIEAGVSEKVKELIEILYSDEVDTCYKNLLSSVNTNQLGQVFVNISLKPDLFGRVIPEPINTSFFMGLRNSTDYFINAIGARKALVVNAQEVSKAGYLGRKLSLLVIRSQLADVEDCGGEALPLFVHNDDAAKRFMNRYIVLPGAKKYTLVDKANYKDLVGKTIGVRSPITCKVGDFHFCHKCYGANAKHIPWHPGLANSTKQSEQIQQKMLGTKHLLKVLADEIILPSPLNEYMVVERSQVNALKDFRIRLSDIEYDQYGEAIVERVTILDGDLEEEVDVSEFNFMATNLLPSLNVELEGEVKANDELFTISVENNDIGTATKRLLRLLENQKELDKYSHPSALVMDFITVLQEANIDLSSVAIEIIVSCMMRNPENLQEPPTDINNAVFLMLRSAIMENPSLSVSLSFERRANMLENGIFSKDKSSVLDVMY